MPAVRDWLAAAEVGGKVYAIGGDDGTSRLGANVEYDPVADVWTYRTPLPSARASLAAAQAAGKLYALGGDDGTTAWLDFNEEYDPGWTYFVHGRD